MKQHKWHKEIKAWADGALIEFRYENDGVWAETISPQWGDSDVEYRIKPQPKEPQYLYVYYGKLKTGDKGYFFEQQRVPYIENGYIGKIKLEVDDE